jgi:hypothetical protein
MKKTVVLLSIIAAALFFACSEWTEPQALPIERPSADAENPALYQQYLENLRNYKKTYHPLLIGWFDNSDKSFSGRASHLKAVPDKVDILSLLYPDDLATVEQEEMAAIRADKGTRVIYTIDYEAFRQSIEAQNEEIITQNKENEGEEGYEPIPLIVLTDVLPDFLDAQIALMDKYAYDGFSIHYSGKVPVFMTDEEKEELRMIQSILFGRVSAAMTKYTGKLFIFEGVPENVLDKTILQSFDYIVLRAYTVTSAIELTAMARKSLVQDVPSDNIIVCVTASYVDELGVQMGKMMAADGSTQSAITEAAWWVKDLDSFTKRGLGILRINEDYFNPDIDYRYTREAIEIMNPSSKN